MGLGSFIKTFVSLTAGAIAGTKQLMEGLSLNLVFNLLSDIFLLF